MEYTLTLKEVSASERDQVESARALAPLVVSPLHVELFRHEKRKDVVRKVSIFALHTKTECGKMGAFGLEPATTRIPGENDGRHTNQMTDLTDIRFLV